jgi:SnoaL-like polyketide cyclase
MRELMIDLQPEKDLVRNFLSTLDAADAASSRRIMEEYCAESFFWRGMHPFNEITGAANVANAFWSPLKTSMCSMTRRMDVFMAGQDSLNDDAAIWVTSMGHLMVLFDKPWLGIQPTGKIAMLRYAEFHRVADGRIQETAMFFDIPHLMMQAGLNPFPAQTAAHLVQPGPATHDGLMFDAQDPSEGVATLDAISHMVKDLGHWDLGIPLEEELARTWHDDMIWWGPAGIGSTFTIKRYAKQHSGPFRAGFSERSSTKHICRIGEGSFGGFFGWPNFMATPTGGFMGMPATGKPGEFRVVDIYRRRDDKLAENWIFIDLLHFWNQQGLDILGRMAEISRT